MGAGSDRLADLDRQKAGLQHKIDRLSAAVDKLQGIAYDVQMGLETPVQVYDAGPHWQGSAREQFESDRRSGKDELDGFRREVDEARYTMMDRISFLERKLDDVSRRRMIDA